MKDKVVTAHNNAEWVGQKSSFNVLEIRMAVWRLLSDISLSSENDELIINTEGEKYD